MGGFVSKLLAQSGRPGPSDDYWYQRPFGLSVETKAGAHVDPNTALGIPAVWICVRIISEDVASLPLHLYQRLEQGKKRAVSHPLYPLLHDRPNPEMSAISFRETQMAHLLTWGNAYAEKELDLMGRVKALWPIGPHCVQVFRDNDTQEIFYKVTIEPSGRVITLPRERMLHVPGLSYNGLVGYSPLMKLRETVGLAAALEEFGARFFGQGTHPGVVVSHPSKLSPEAHDRLKGSLIDGYSGLGKSHRLLLLEEDMKIDKIGIPPNEAQFIESRKFSVAEIGSRVYRIPLHMLGEQDKAAAYASVEQFALQYVKHTLRPWLVRLEQSYQWQLLATDLERRRYFWEHLVEGLLRGDIKTRYEAYRIGRNWGWLSPDDVRELENMNPLPDGKGSNYLVPGNMQIVKSGGQESVPVQPPPAPEPPQAALDWRNERCGGSSLADSFKPLFVDALEQILSREANHLQRLLKGAAEPAAVIAGFYGPGADIRAFIARKIGPVITAFAENYAGPGAEEAAQEIEFFTENHIKTSKNELLGAGNGLELLMSWEDRAVPLAEAAILAIAGQLEGKSHVQA